MNQELPYRKCVAMFVQYDGKVFAGERSDTVGAWQCPQGGVEKNENIIDAARRELKEETGIVSVDFFKKTDTPLKYNFTDESQKNCIKKYGSLKYTGQEVTFVVFNFTGNESEINLDATSPREFSNWCWMDLKILLNNLVDFKKDVFIHAAQQLELI